MRRSASDKENVQVKLIDSFIVCQLYSYEFVPFNLAVITNCGRELIGSMQSKKPWLLFALLLILSCYSARLSIAAACW
jgi:hypothetical protein